MACHFVYDGVVYLHMFCRGCFIGYHDATLVHGFIELSCFKHLTRQIGKILEANRWSVVVSGHKNGGRLDGQQ